MRVDPTIARIFAENVRAEVIAPPPVVKLDLAMVQKIKKMVPMFSGMSPECLTHTLAMAEYFPVKAGEVVFNEGDIGDSFFVLISGEVVVEKFRHGQAVELARLAAGHCFGEMALVGRPVRTACVRATRDAMTLRFYRDLVDANVESAHIMYRNMASILASRLDDASMTLTALATQQASP